MAFFLSVEDSNPHKRNQNPSCYHYTNRHYKVYFLPLFSCSVKNMSLKKIPSVLVIHRDKYEELSQNQLFFKKNLRKILVLKG
jgi:hypothetical protein